MSYDHTQRGPLGWWLLGGGILMFALAAASPRAALPGLLIGASSMVLAGCTVQSLRVRDRGDHLLVAFGPVPLFRRKIPYAEIRGVHARRSTWMDGWGIHYMRCARGRGWIYNLWGFDCVELDLGERKFILGTDDPKRLAQFLERRIGRDPRS